MAETKPPLIRRALARGELNETQKLLLRLGRKRLGEPTEEAQSAINALQNTERLEQLCERVYDVESWEDLLQP